MKTLIREFIVPAEGPSMPPRPAGQREFAGSASAARAWAEDRLGRPDSSYKIRCVSHSPDPAPRGSVVVYKTLKGRRR